MMPDPRADESFFGSCNGRLWSIGGNTDQAHQNDLWSWALGESAWTTSHASSGKSEKFCSHTGAEQLVCDEATKTLWIIGTRHFNDVGKYEIATNTWIWGISTIDAAYYYSQSMGTLTCALGMEKHLHLM